MKIMTITKTVINKVLKEMGMGFVKLDDGGFYSNGVCYTNGAGKRVKGIPAASHGPMTVTDAYRTHIADKKLKVRNALVEAGISYDYKEDLFIANKDAKKPITFKLMEDWFPAYTRSAGYDSGYQSIYITVNYL